MPLQFSGRQFLLFIVFVGIVSFFFLPITADDKEEVDKVKEILKGKDSHVDGQERVEQPNKQDLFLNASKKTNIVVSGFDFRKLFFIMFGLGFIAENIFRLNEDGAKEDSHPVAPSSTTTTQPPPEEKASAKNQVNVSQCSGTRYLNDLL